jgi:hypothetical protein
MLRNSSEEDMAEMAQIFGEAMAKLAEERAAAGPVTAPSDRRPTGGRRRRRPTAAERRQQRRLHT